MFLGYSQCSTLENGLTDQNIQGLYFLILWTATKGTPIIIEREKYFTFVKVVLFGGLHMCNNLKAVNIND